MEISRNFDKIKPHLRCRSYFETLPTWKGPFNLGMIVPMASAGFGENSIAVGRDHSMLCRFDSEKAWEYQSISRMLEGFFTKAMKPGSRIQSQADPTSREGFFMDCGMGYTPDELQSCLVTLCQRSSLIKKQVGYERVQGTC